MQQDVKHALSPVLRKFVGRGSRMAFLPAWVHCTGGVSFPSQFQDRDHNRGCFARSYLWHWLSWSVPGVTPFSTGPRSAVPPQQYWMTHAAAIMDSLAGHFQSLFPQSHVAQVLQSQSSWVGGEHLSGNCVRPNANSSRMDHINFLLWKFLRPALS